MKMSSENLERWYVNDVPTDRVDQYYLVKKNNVVMDLPVLNDCKTRLVLLYQEVHNMPNWKNQKAVPDESGRPVPIFKPKNIELYNQEVEFIAGKYTELYPQSHAEIARFRALKLSENYSDCALSVVPHLPVNPLTPQREYKFAKRVYLRTMVVDEEIAPLQYLNLVHSIRNPVNLPNLEEKFDSRFGVADLNRDGEGGGRLLSHDELKDITTLLKQDLRIAPLVPIKKLAYHKKKECCPCSCIIL